MIVAIMQNKMFATLCSLLLLLLCIEMQLAFPIVDVLPTTELAPASGSGSGSGQQPSSDDITDDDNFNTIYNMLVEQNRSIDIDVEVMAGGSGMAVTPTSPVGGDGSCNLFRHYVVVRFQGCVGMYPAFSCAGKCQTEQGPNYFQQRDDARINPFITTCKCCSAVSGGYKQFTMTLECPDDTTLRVLHTTGYITDCSCSSCF